MKRTCLLIACLLAAAPFAALAQPATPQLSDADIEAAFTAMAKYELGLSRLSLSNVEEAIRAAAGKPAILKGYETRLASLLESGATPDAQRFICRQLAVIGSGDSVSYLSPLMRNQSTCDMAVQALQLISGPEALAALSEAAERLPADLRISAINALGRRGDPAAVPALAGQTTNEDAKVASAATAALGFLPCADALATLENLQPKAKPELQAPIADALLKCGEGLVRDGKVDEAEALYKKLYVPAQPGHIRAAALTGLAKLDPPAALDLLKEAVNDADTQIADAAFGLIRTLPGEGVTQVIAGFLAAAAPERQVILLNALADRADPAAGDAARALLDSADEAVRLAAIAALGRMGDNASVPVILKLAATAEGKARRVARETLDTMPGENVNPQLLAAATGNDAPLRVEAIRSLGERRAVETVDTLIELARDPQDDAATQAVQSLEVLADAGRVDGMVTLLEAEQRGAVRDALVKALVATLQRTGAAEPPAQVMDKYANAATPELRYALLRVIAGVPSELSLNTLTAALAAEDAGLRLAAMDALGQWPDAGVAAGILAGVVRKPAARDDRDAAFDACLRQLRAWKTGPAAQRGALYIEALGWAKTPAEKKKVISGMADAPTLDTLAKACENMSDAAVAHEANIAALRIAKTVAGAAPEKARELVDAALKSGDESLKKDAEAIAKMMEGFQNFLVAWEISGPYSEQGKTCENLPEATFAPETDPANAAWRIMPMGLNPGATFVCDMLQAINDGGSQMVYLRTHVTVPKECPALLEIGSNDGVKVWLNGQVLETVPGGRALAVDQDKLPVTLKAENDLLIAVYNCGGPWELCARIVTPDGGAVEGLKAGLPK